tara:strand:+ start:377 stop:580 length:204 start_codon:yes stop_codon:yes gene_type:complete
MKYLATLCNDNCAFDSVILSNVNGIKDWAKGRGYSYFLKIESIYDDLPNELVIIYNVKNNKFYKVKK